MAEEPRKSSKSRFATTVIEKNETMPALTAATMPRKETPVGMPAPPAPSAPRTSSDDIERVQEQDRFERERVKLLLEKQELEEENARLRKEQRTEVFPPVVSIPPPPAPPTVSSIPADEIEKIKKQIVKSKMGRAAVTLGVLAALALGAFNSARVLVPIQKSEATQARLEQTEKVTEESLRRKLENDQRTLQALRALHCYAKQTRGGFQRHGLDLTSLPPGGIKVVRLAEEDPNRPAGPPRFIVDEKCPDFPKLPPEP